MTNQPFWQMKSLQQMNDDEWEALCDGCGRCCLNKLQDADSDEIYFTNIACNQLNLKTCACRHYAHRFTYEPSCIQLTRENIGDFAWLPPTCAYRLLAENRPLPAWHPLLTGSKKAMHAAGISVKFIAVHEREVTDWEAHIISSMSLADEATPLAAPDELRPCHDKRNQ